MFAQGLLQNRLQSLKQRTKPEQWPWCSWVGIQVCKLLPVAPQWMWGWFLLYVVGNESQVPQLSLGESCGKTLGFTESSTGNRFTNKHQEQEHPLNPFLAVKCHLPFRLPRFETSIARFRCLLEKKTTNNKLSQSLWRSIAVLVSAPQLSSSEYSGNTGLNQSSCLTGCKSCPPFPKNALGIILGLGLFQLSPVEAPLPDVQVFLEGGSGNRVTNVSALSVQPAVFNVRGV